MPAIVPIPSLPHCVTPEEHADLVSKTPENFDDIPPVLRCRRENVRVESDPAIPGISSPVTGTLHVIERFYPIPSLPVTSVDVSLQPFQRLGFHDGRWNRLPSLVSEYNTARYQ